MKIYRLFSGNSGISPSGPAIFTVRASRCCAPSADQYLVGTWERIEIQIPFNAPPERPCRIMIDDGRDVFGSGISIEALPVCNQYTLQGDAFSRAILEDTEVPVPMNDAVKNMAVIEAIFRSAVSGKREVPLDGD